MKSLCIYLIYDKENIIERYITYMLKELRLCCEYLLVVCNSRSVWRGENIDRYADQVICRDNIGYDAGGFKDALCSYIGWNKLSEYDELVLANDSFYGPFFPISQIFKAVSVVRADYWGMTRSQAGKTIEGMQYKEHIQSYFLVFRKSIINSRVFKEFWVQLEYPKTMDEAIEYFELGINKCLKQNGFQDFAVSDLYNNIPAFKEGENPYLKYPLELIRDCKMPFLKCKALAFTNGGYTDAFRAYQFIENNNLYNVECIKEHILRKSKFEKNMLNLKLLEEFYERHERVFIYGFGVYGKNVGFYFQSRGWRIEGFLVTHADENCRGAIMFEQAEIRKDDGIVVAVGTTEVCVDILKYLKSKCKESQLLFPNL